VEDDDMTTAALRGFFTVVLPFTLLFAPVPLDGQTPGGRSVVVLPFGFQEGPFVRDVDRAFAADVATQIDRSTTYRVLELDVLIDASPITREFSEEERTTFDCITARQVAEAENLDLFLLCGSVVAMRTGYGIEAVVYTTASGAECRLRSDIVEDRNSAVRHVAAQFQEWAQSAEPSCFR